MNLLRALALASIGIVSLINAVQGLGEYFHFPSWHNPALLAREGGLGHTKAVLRKLGSHVGYRVGPNGNLDAPQQFHENQYLLAPTVLRRNSTDDPYVLVYFGIGELPVPMPGLTFMEDFGNGFALHRKEP